MPSIPVDLQSARDIVGFSIGLIALMQAGVWYTERERGMAWFVLGSLLATLLVASGTMTRPMDAPPERSAILAMYTIRDLFALGLSVYLGMPARTRLAVVGALILPSLLFAAALLVGVPAQQLPLPLPLLWVDLGMSATCLVAARRQPGVGHDLLAAAPLLGPALALLTPWRGTDPHLNQTFPPSVLSFGIVILVAGLRRHSRASSRAQALAQRMSDFYAALSHTNQAILRIHDPQALCEEICRICARWGHVQLACVYRAQGTLAHRVCEAGPAVAALQGIPNPWDMSSPAAQASNTVRALREGVPIISHDYLGDPHSGPWRAQALAHGVRTLAWLPLRHNAEVVAVLMLGASEPGYFNGALVALLDEMTQDISFAFDNIDRDARHAEAARQVQAGLDRFGRLFETAPVSAAIISIDERRIVDVNRAMCQRYAMARAQMIGRAVASLPWVARPADREAFYALLHAHGRVSNFTVEMYDAQGGTHLDLANAEIIDYLGQPCYLLMSLDISELRAAQEARQALAESQAASRAKTQFLSSMSHELRTPLNAVLGFSALLRHEAVDRLTPQQLAQLDHVQQAGWHLLRLINDVLDLSRIEAGQIGVSPHALELGPLLDEALQMNRPQAAQGDIALRPLYHGAAPLWVRADPTRLRQVVLNVISNAIKYGRPQGNVQVRAFRHAGGVAIEVVDTGLGMSAQQLQHLFEPFNRLGRDAQGIEGTGIGLSLTRQLMQLMNGAVEITSEEGHGTRVLLTLPGADATPSQVPAIGAPPPLPGGERAPRGTVLYIEDNEVNTLLVEQLLARWDGVRFVAARDGGTGLRVALALRPDLVLLDLQLPDIDGLEVLGHLRASDSARDTPVVVLSATAMPSDIAQAHERGATDYWTKPLDFQHFLNGVTLLLQRAEGRAASAAD